MGREVVPGACITVLLLFRNLTVVSELFSFTPGPFFLRPSDWSYSPLAWIQCLNIHLNRINTRAAWPAYILHLFVAPFTTKHRLLLSYLALQHCTLHYTPSRFSDHERSSLRFTQRHCHATVVTIRCSLFVSRDASFIPTPQHQDLYI